MTESQDPNGRTFDQTGDQPGFDAAYRPEGPSAQPYAPTQPYPGQAPQQFAGAGMAPYAPQPQPPYGHVAPQPYAQVAMVAPKSKVAAALLAFFLGGAGIHRFYLGYAGTGAVMLVMSVLGWLLSIVGVGFLLLLPVGLWAFIDFIRVLTGGLRPKDGAPMI